jgi:hypothetical protein
MTHQATETRRRDRSHLAALPHLPPIARDPLDDAHEALFAFDSKQAGRSDVPYADIAEDLACALRSALGMLSRPPARPVLRPMALLDVAQAEKFLMDLEHRTQGADATRIAYLLGQAERHLQDMTDLVRAVTRLPR